MEKIRIGLLGLNYDTEAGRGWPGARYAPDSIRRALAAIMNRMEDGYLFDVCNNCLIDYNQIDIRDYGNCDEIPHYNHNEALRGMSDKINEIFDDKRLPILLGGDHSVTNAGFTSIYEKTEGNIGILDLDAHLDLKYDSVQQGKYSGSSEIRRAIERDRIHGKNVVEIGPRGFNYPEHYHFIKESGMTIITPQEVFNQGAEATAKKALEKAMEGTDSIYLTVDIDALDMGFALGSGGQEPAGLTHFQMSSLIREFAPYVKAVDFVEVNPMTDHRELTSHVAANLILDFIAARYLAAL